MIPARPRLFRTAAGASAAALGPAEWGLMLAIASMWGSSFLFIAVGLESLEPTVISFGRVLLGAIAIGLIPRARRAVDREDRPSLVLLGVVWIAVPFTFYPIAQQWVDSSVAGLINGSMPIFAGLIAAVMLRRRPGPAQIAGLAFGFAGVATITIQSVNAGDQSLLGIGLLIIATLGYGLSVNLTIPLTQKYGSLAVIWRAQLVAVALLLPFGLWGLQTSTFTWPVVGSLAFLGVLSTGVALVFMGELARRAGAVRASVTIYLVPVVAVILGVVVRDERRSLLTLVGGALVLIGAWLTSRVERGR